MRLMNNDLVILSLDSGEIILRVVKIGSNGQIFFAGHAEANANARSSDKEDPFSYISKMAGSLQSVKARRITVSEIGEVRDSGFSR